MKTLYRRIQSLEGLRVVSKSNNPAVSGGIMGKALRLLSYHDLESLEVIARDKQAGRDVVVNESYLAVMTAWKAALEKCCLGAGFASLAEYQQSRT